MNVRHGSKFSHLILMRIKAYYHLHFVDGEYGALGNGTVSGKPGHKSKQSNPEPTSNHSMVSNTFPGWTVQEHCQWDVVWAALCRYKAKAAPEELGGLVRRACPPTPWESATDGHLKRSHITGIPFRKPTVERTLPRVVDWKSPLKFRAPGLTLASYQTVSGPPRLQWGLWRSTSNHTQTSAAWQQTRHRMALCKGEGNEAARTKK